MAGSIKGTFVPYVFALMKCADNQDVVHSHAVHAVQCAALIAPYGGLRRALRVELA